MCGDIRVKINLNKKESTMKKLCLAFVIIFLTAINVSAVSVKDVSMSVLLDKQPVRELPTVAIPFDSEYELRIANNTNRDCAVSITIYRS